ncbi:MAG: ribonuclease HII [Chloroflexi bacterium]|nr:ribonuclease HII [Chloroflexota bacterium]
MARPRPRGGPTWEEEQRLLGKGYRWVAGVDEVGRGPLAGPVVAAAVILDPDLELPWYPQLQDSKVLSPRQRGRLAALIRGAATAFGIGAADAQEVDARGVVKATRAAMARAVAGLALRPDYLLIDAVPLPEAQIPFRAIIRGDALCRSIAAASIVAKVERDGQMERLDETYSGYGFARHKGYGTQEHLRRLGALGPSAIHRRTFAPVRALLSPAQGTEANSRRAAGRAAEQAAADFLQARGYRLLDRNFRCPWGELDLVAEEGGTVVFVEVRARRSDALGSPLESVTLGKQRRLVLAAQEYLQQHGLESRPWRIDVLGARLGLGGQVEALEHLEHAVGL